MDSYLRRCSGTTEEEIILNVQDKPDDTWAPNVSGPTSQLIHRACMVPNFLKSDLAFIPHIPLDHIVETRPRTPPYGGAVRRWPRPVKC